MQRFRGMWGRRGRGYQRERGNQREGRESRGKEAGRRTAGSHQQARQTLEKREEGVEAKPSERRNESKTKQKIECKNKIIKILCKFLKLTILPQAFSLSPAIPPPHILTHPPLPQSSRTSLQFQLTFVFLFHFSLPIPAVETNTS